jgi:BASS family bile acid:Na+ symporter
MNGAILETVAQVGILAFVVTSMLAMGTSLTLAQIVEPLRNSRLVIAVLAANFVAVPALAFILTRVLTLDAPAATAIILLGTMAGAPFLPKLAQAAHGDVAFSVGLMVLLMVVTIGYAPVVVPLLLEGADVAAWDIARPLLFLMLLPLALALLCRERYPDLAKGWSPELARISSTSLAIALAAAVIVAYEDILGAIGSQIFLATLLLAVGSVAIGWLVTAGNGAATRSVAGFGTAQRNLAAAQLVAGTSFGGDTLVQTIAASLALAVLLVVVAGEFGKRVGQSAPVPATPAAE